MHNIVGNTLPVSRLVRLFPARPSSLSRTAFAYISSTRMPLGRLKNAIAKTARLCRRTGIFSSCVSASLACLGRAKRTRPLIMPSQTFSRKALRLSHRRKSRKRSFAYTALRLRLLVFHMFASYNTVHSL